MIQLWGENYYIDLDQIEKYIDMGRKDNQSGDTESRINIIKFEMVKMLLETVLT
jgi:hypothetical protein